jgi:hypothetical protein
MSRVIPSLLWLGYKLDDWGSIPNMAKIFLLVNMSKPALLPIQFLIQWVPEPVAMGIKRTRREADCSSPSIAMLRNLLE